MASVRYHLSNLVYEGINKLLFRIAILRDALYREMEYRYDLWQNTRMMAT